jgi:tetratricopeptide (TPR) repeat protein
MRTARLVAIPLILLLGAAEGRGQESKPDPRRTERDRLVSEIAALRSTGKRAAAVDRLERLLVLERDLFGEVSEEVVVTTDSLAVLLEMQGEVDAARERRKKVIEIRTALSGPEHWKTVDARRALADLEVRAALTPEQRRRLAELPAHERRFHVLYQAGRKAEAVEPGMAILAIHEVVYGPEHPNTAASLCNLGLLYCSTGDPGQSHEFLLRARAIFERILGPDHPETASSLNNLALLYSTYGARDRAIPLYRRALAIRRKVLGSDHADTGLSLFNLATALGSEGPDADEALRLLHESLAVYERRFGPEHPETAPCLGRIGEHHESRGEFAEALRFHERALRIHEKGLGAEHPRTATSLGQLAEVCASLGRLDEAVAHQRRALAIREKVLGPNHHATAIACTDLAGFLESKGEHREALALYERARGSIESVYGPDHPRMASLLNDLAVLRKAMGRYAEALSLYTRALEIWEKKVGPEHPNTAASLNNLAQLYRSMGDLDRARPLYERTLAICEKVLGPEHPHTVMTRGNLSGILVAMGDYEKALSIRETVLAYCERKLGPEHPHTIVSLGAVAELLSSMGAHDRALPLFERALRSAERTLGPKHPRTAITLNDLAILLDATGDHDRARRCYERSLAIDEERYGPEHPETALNLENFALFLGETGETERAHRLAVRSLRAHRTIAETVAVIQAERQQLREFRRMKFTLDLCLSTAGEGNVDAVHSAVLAAKGLVLARQSLLRARRSRPELAETFEDYEGVCRRLSSLLLSASDRESAGERLEQVRTLIERQEALEAELAAGSEDFRRERESRRFASADVAATLPEGAVLIDFLAYDRLLPRAAGTPGRSRWERCYVAFVLRPGGDPVRVDLGPAQPIDDLITAWRREVLSARAPGAGARLRELLWEPLREHLGDATSVILSPDDALSRLPLRGAARSGAGELPGRPVRVPDVRRAEAPRAGAGADRDGSGLVARRRGRRLRSRDGRADGSGDDEPRGDRARPPGLLEASRRDAPGDGRGATLLHVPVPEGSGLDAARGWSDGGGVPAGGREAPMAPRGDPRLLRTGEDPLGARGDATGRARKGAGRGRRRPPGSALGNRARRREPTAAARRRRRDPHGARGRVPRPLGDGDGRAQRMRDGSRRGGRRRGRPRPPARVPGGGGAVDGDEPLGRGRPGHEPADDALLREALGRGTPARGGAAARAARADAEPGSSPHAARRNPRTGPARRDPGIRVRSSPATALLGRLRALRRRTMTPPGRPRAGAGRPSTC